jgi:hypothetical protein
MAETNVAALPKEVADKYDLKHLTPGTYEVPKIGIVDFTTIDLKTAAKVAKKTSYLVEKVVETIKEKSKSVTTT